MSVNSLILGHLITADQEMTVTGQQVLKSDEMINSLFEITAKERAVNDVVRDVDQSFRG